MIIYNVTTKIHNDIHQAWLQWMKAEHIPAMLATDCFTGATITRLLETDDSEGPTYAVQYAAENKAAYDLYIEKYSLIMRQETITKWKDRFIAFRSLMEVVN